MHRIYVWSLLPFIHSIYIYNIYIYIYRERERERRERERERERVKCALNVLYCNIRFDLKLPSVRKNVIFCHTNAFERTIPDKCACAQEKMFALYVRAKICMALCVHT